MKYMNPSTKCEREKRDLTLFSKNEQGLHFDGSVTHQLVSKT